MEAEIVVSDAFSGFGETCPCLMMYWQSQSWGRGVGLPTNHPQDTITVFSQVLQAVDESTRLLVKEIE